MKIPEGRYVEDLDVVMSVVLSSVQRKKILSLPYYIFVRYGCDESSEDSVQS